METTEEKKCGEIKKCGCFCHKMTGLFIAVMGVVALLTIFEVIPLKAGAITVSILIILTGLQKMMSGVCKCCNAA